MGAIDTHDATLYEGVPIAEFGSKYPEIDPELLSGFLFASFQFARLELKQPVKEVIFERSKYLFFPFKELPTLLILIVDLDDSRTDYFDLVRKIQEELLEFRDLFTYFDGDLGKIELVFNNVLSNILCSYLKLRRKKYRKRKRTEFYCSLLNKRIFKKDVNFCHFLNMDECLREREKFRQTTQIMLSFLPFEHGFQQIDFSPFFDKIYDFTKKSIEQRLELEKRLVNNAIELALSFLPFEHDFQLPNQTTSFSKLFDLVKENIERSYNLKR